MVAQGHPNKVIAGVLNINCWAVGTHLRRVFSKLGVTSRAATIARLIEQHSLAETGLLSDARSSNPQTVSASVEDQPIAKKPSASSAVHCLVELGKRQH